MTTTLSDEEQIAEFLKNKKATKLAPFVHPSKVSDNDTKSISDVAKECGKKSKDFISLLQEIGVLSRYELNSKKESNRLVFSADFVEKGYGYMFISSSKVNVKQDDGTNKIATKKFSQARFSQAGIDYIKELIEVYEDMEDE